MAVEVTTKDSSALADSDLDELASMGGSFDIGVLSKAREDWVLFTAAREGGKLQGFTFSTLERIGGTPCVLLGVMSVKPTGKRDAVLKALMAEAFHRALMAFPDEDVVVGSRFVTPGALDAFKSLTDIIPRPGHRAVGEERAWGKRLARRFGVEANYDDQSFVVKEKGQSGFIDFVTTKPEKVKPEIAAMFKTVNPKKGGVIIVHGWTMTESLAKLGAR